MTGGQLKQIRKKLNMTVADAAESVHITARAWHRYEDGTRPISKTIIHLFCLLNELDAGKYLK